MYPCLPNAIYSSCAAEMQDVYCLYIERSDSVLYFANHNLRLQLQWKRRGMGSSHWVNNSSYAVVGMFDMLACLTCSACTTSLFMLQLWRCVHLNYYTTTSNINRLLRTLSRKCYKRTDKCKVCPATDLGLHKMRRATEITQSAIVLPSSINAFEADSALVNSSTAWLVAWPSWMRAQVAVTLNAFSELALSSSMKNLSLGTHSAQEVLWMELFHERGRLGWFLHHPVKPQGDVSDLRVTL